MKKFFLFPLLSLLSTMMLYPSSAAPAPKAGAKCTKVNSTLIVGTKKFTCVKSGTKLVWNKGVSLATSVNPSSTSAPKNPSNPFKSTPFPDRFTRDQMVESALDSFDKYVKQNSSKQNFKLIIDKDFQHKSKEITKLVEEVFSSLPYPSGYPAIIFVATRDRQLIENSVKEFSDFYKPGQSQMEVKPCLNCANLGWASTSLGLSDIVPHEIFHTWQKAVYTWQNLQVNLDPKNPMAPPVWLDEGGAEFFGKIFYRSVEDYYPGSLVSSKPYQLQDYRTREIDGNLPYSLGRLASEYIVASKGFENFLRIYSNVGQGQDFPTAFESALGISLDSFYEKFNKNLQNML